jgi:exonuclease SbcC
MHVGSDFGARNPMRFEKVVIHGFGPFPGTQTINFHELSNAGLFLMTGPIGAGKTTMLDAICFALYGETTGEGQAAGALDGRSGAELRCSRATSDQETKVELIFRVKDSVYKIERSPEYFRPKLRGEGDTREPASVNLYQWVASDGTEGYRGTNDSQPEYLSSNVANIHSRWRPICSKRAEVATEIEKITGFDAQQFRRVILIPQGRFRDVLISAHDSRQDLLKKIFKTEVFERFSIKTLELEQARKLVWREQQRSLEDLLTPFAWTEGMPGEAIEARIVSELQTARDKLVSTKSQKLDWTNKLAIANQALGEAEYIKKLCESIQAEEGLLETANRLLQELAPVRSELERGKAAAPLAQSLQDFRQIEDQIAKDNAILDEFQKESQEAIDTEKRTIAEFQSACIKFKQVESIDQNLGQIAERLQQAEQVRKRSTQAQGEVQSAKEALKKTQDELVALEAKLAKAAQETEQSKSNHEAALKRYHDASAARLAAILIPGIPCPVCGSPDHPKPTVSSELIPSEDELKELNASATKAQKEFEKLKLETATNGEQLKSQQQLLKNAQQRLDDAPPIPDVAAMKEEKRQLEESREEITQLKITKERESQLASKEVERVKLAIAACEAKIRANQELASKGREVFRALLSDSSFDSESEVEAAFRDPKWISETDQKISEATKNAASASSRLEGLRTNLGSRPVPDLGEMHRARSAIENSLQQVELEYTNAQRSVESLTRFQTQYLERSRKTSVAEKAYQTALSLSQMVNGKRPGENRLSLHSWILASVMEQVLSQATAILRTMTRNRYELIRSTRESGGASQKGLDIDVLDTWHGTVRPARTLSGGETFLASLAFSLALAQTAATYQGGRPLDTIFIDEGFGSLDAESLEVAIQALTTLRDQGRVVGVISHVEEMQRSIGTQLCFNRNGEHVKIEAVL